VIVKWFEQLTMDLTSHFGNIIEYLLITSNIDRKLETNKDLKNIVEE